VVDTAHESVGRRPLGFDTPVTLVTERFPGRPVYDTAVTHALVRRVAEGALPETLRLYVPDDVVLFSLLDARRPGFAAARAAAARAGSGAVLRLAGGHAALFHERCLAFSWATPDTREPDAIRRRFETVSSWLCDGLRRLGVDARIGAVEGEYCPGEYSVSAGGRTKLMGVGQRVIRGAAHVGGVIVVGDSERVRDVLGPVYEAIGLRWEPRTAGAVEDEAAGVDVAAARDAILEALGERRAWRHGALDGETLARAEDLLDWHDPERSPRSAAIASDARTKLVVTRD